MILLNVLPYKNEITFQRVLNCLSNMASSTSCTSDELIRLCSGCEESIAEELLYKCTQCNMSDEPEALSDFLCDQCLVLHIKKGHTVLDHRNMKPAVCPDHKQLCLDYRLLFKRVKMFRILLIFMNKKLNR